MNIGKLMKRSCPQLTEAEMESYEAPFPTEEYKAGVRRFPKLVPDTPNTSVAELGKQYEVM
jgi:hypothetical protein